MCLHLCRTCRRQRTKLKQRPRALEMLLFFSMPAYRTNEHTSAMIPSFCSSFALFGGAGLAESVGLEGASHSIAWIDAIIKKVPRGAVLSRLFSFAPGSGRDAPQTHRKRKRNSQRQLRKGHRFSSGALRATPSFFSSGASLSWLPSRPLPRFMEICPASLPPGPGGSPDAPHASREEEQPLRIPGNSLWEGSGLRFDADAGRAKRQLASDGFVILGRKSGTEPNDAQAAGPNKKKRSGRGDAKRRHLTRVSGCAHRNPARRRRGMLQECQGKGRATQVTLMATICSGT